MIAKRKGYVGTWMFLREHMNDGVRRVNTEHPIVVCGVVNVHA